MRIFTIGHSTRSIDEFIELCRAHGIRHVIDVRRFPGSRRHPHFARQSLTATLGGDGIGYTWLEDLGGRRSRRPDSPHTAWKVAAFAAYADHMETPAFEHAMRQALTIAERAQAALMCAEARVEQCHRRLIADWLVARGGEVLHVSSKTRAAPHSLPPFARLDGQRIVYDAGQSTIPDA
jgi:uncharacterized protein (DUF488 family)